MKHIRISRISPASLSMICGIFYFLLGIVFAAVGLVAALGGGTVTMTGPVSFSGRADSVVWLLLFSPFIYAFLGMIGGFLAAWAYNFVVRFTKGLLLEITETDRIGF